MIELKESGVVFEPIEHRYFLGDKELKGVTSTLVHAAFPNDYDGIDEEVLRRAAERGSAIHKVIEDYEESDAFDNAPELTGYVTIKERHHLTHVASEYLVTDGETYASAIDHVFTDEDGGIVLGDVKTTYKKNYEKTACQLSIYRRFFEAQNPGLKVAKLGMIWLRGDNYEYKELTPWADEALDALFTACGEGKKFDITETYGDLPKIFAEAEDEIAFRMEVYNEAKEWLEKFKAGIYPLMEKFNVKKWTGRKVKMTRVLPTETTSFDNKRFKADHPDLYAQYCKKSTRSGSIQIKDV